MTGEIRIINGGVVITMCKENLTLYIRKAYFWYVHNWR